MDPKETKTEEVQNTQTRHFAALSLAPGGETVLLALQDVGKTMTIVIEWDPQTLINFVLRAMQLIDELSEHE